MLNSNHNYYLINNPMQMGLYVSDVDFEEKRISSSYVASLFELGLSEREIEDKLLKKYNIDEFENSDIFASAKKHVQDILSIVKKHYDIDNKDDDSQSPVLDETSETETQNEPIDLTQLSLSPLEEDIDSWNLNNAGDLFSEDITKEDFLFEYDFLKQSSELLALTGEDSEIMGYLNNIEEIGAQNFFDALDSDMNGILDVDEINSFVTADGDETSISASEFNNALDTAYETISQNNTKESSPVEKAKEIINDVKNRAQARRSGSSGAPASPVPKEETLADLQKQRQEIITSSDAEIEKLNNQLETLISTAPIEDDLKNTYLNAKEAFDNNQQLITQKDEEIYNYDNQLHNADVQLASLKGELNNLETNTDNSELNAKNIQRKSEIETQIRTLEKQKIDIEKQKQTTLDAKKELEELANNPENGLKKQMDEAYVAMSASLAPEIKTQIDSIKSQIEQAEASKTTKLNEIDAKIEAKKAQDIQNGQKSGEMKGKVASNQIGALILETAKKYLGYNEADGSYKLFSTGNYGWCADFVTYVVKEAFGKLGYTKDQLKALARNFLGASPYKLRTKNKEHYYQTGNIPQSAYESLVGTAFICKGSGASGEHTGLVLSVDVDKGTFMTLEGNSGNKVRTQERRISDMYGFVDFSYLYNV